jgi:hypothetical protein
VIDDTHDIGVAETVDRLDFLVVVDQDDLLALLASAAAGISSRYSGSGNSQLLRMAADSRGISPRRRGTYVLPSSSVFINWESITAERIESLSGCL